MIDHLLGRPSTAHRRWQVLLVLIFWTWRLRSGARDGPRILTTLGITRRAGKLSAWQTVVATLSAIYTIRNWESLLGLQAVRRRSARSS